MMRFFYPFCCLLLTTQAWAELKQAEMKSSVKPSSQIEEMKPFERAPAKPSAPSTTPLPPPPKPQAAVPQQASYLNPGILVERGGKWEGGDHLLNLSPHIGVYVTIVKAKTETQIISEEKIKQEVEAIFQEASIQPITLAFPGKPPLPAFQIEILLYPFEKGYAASCAGRLFESVTLDRFKLDPHMAFQAVTWEKQSLIVGPASLFDQQILKQVREIARNFTERFQAYERMRSSRR